MQLLTFKSSHDENDKDRTPFGEHAGDETATSASGDSAVILHNAAEVALTLGEDGVVAGQEALISVGPEMDVAERQAGSPPSEQTDATSHEKANLVPPSAATSKADGVQPERSTDASDTVAAVGAGTLASRLDEAQNPALSLLLKTFGASRTSAPPSPAVSEDPLQQPVYASPLAGGIERRLSSATLGFSKGLADLASGPSSSAESSPAVAPSLTASSSNLHIVFQKHHPVIQSQVRLDIANRPRSTATTPDRLSRSTSPTSINPPEDNTFDQPNVADTAVPKSPRLNRQRRAKAAPGSGTPITSIPEEPSGGKKKKKRRKAKGHPVTPKLISADDGEDTPATCPCNALHTRMTPVLDKVYNVSVSYLWDFLFAPTPAEDESIPLSRFISTRRRSKGFKGTPWHPAAGAPIAEPLPLGYAVAGLARSHECVIPLNNPMGPRSTRSQSTETIEHATRSAFGVLQTTVTPDVPSGNAFVTRTRLCCTRVSMSKARLRVSCEVEFTKFSFLQAVIHPAAVEGVRSYWKDMDEFLTSHVASHPDPSSPQHPS
ncbi:hypothetical protein HK405_013151, partial [Cladochytrium tenue]